MQLFFLSAKAFYGGAYATNYTALIVSNSGNSNAAITATMTGAASSS